MNIYQKINEIMKNIEYLTKDDQVEFGSTKYKAISEEKVTTAVRKELVKQGIVILPVQQESENKELIRTEKSVNMLSSVHVKYRIVNIEDPTDFVEVESNGTGVDTQDKGVGKAMTYCYKYMLLRTFAIPTGEDPDKVSSAEEDYKVANEVEKSKISQTKVQALEKAISNKNIPEDKVIEALNKFGYKSISEILVADYMKVCNEISKEAKWTLQVKSQM